MDREAKVVVVGGANPGDLNSVEMYNLASRTWTKLQPMKLCREGASSVVYNDYIFVTGGYVENSCQTESIEKLSLNAVRVDQSIPWEDVPAKFPGGLFGHCFIVYNGRLIGIGGCDKRAYSNGIFEISLVQPYTSIPLATMPQGSRCYHGCAICGDKIVIVGGRENVWAESTLSSVIMYNITENTCQELAALPYPVSEMATVKLDDDRIMIMGGTDNENRKLKKVFVYNIKTQKSDELPDMKYKRKGCVAAVVRDTVIVMGGQDERGNYLKSVESFRFDRYSWEELPKMNEARYLATAVAC